MTLLESPETADDGRPLPDYITGDECLFCHRFQRESWLENRHNRTLRLAQLEPDGIAELKASDSLASLAGSVDYLMGHKNRTRFLKKSAGYGQLELLSVEMVPAKAESPARLLHGDNPTWDTQKFGRSCAGCHTTQLDSRTKTFSAVALDCYVCHGAATLEHSKDPTLMLLSRAHKDPPRVVVSICGQCHLRGSKSKSTGLPYPNNFVAGGDLFRDFLVDFTKTDDANLNPGDRHIYQNVRDVIDRDKTDVTCLNCHSVHGQSTVAHRRKPQTEICLTCHHATGPKSVHNRYEVHSQVCEY